MYVPGIASIQNKASKRLYNKNAPLSLENQSTEVLQQQFRRMRLMQVMFFFLKMWICKTPPKLHWACSAIGDVYTVMEKKPYLKTL